MAFNWKIIFYGIVLFTFTVNGRSAPSNKWAVLVAGSNGYYNYRHQADVCHAYQILRRNGIPEERIITMMYDDIARDPENPTPNVIINIPNGPDVYEGVKIDYAGEEVNSANFLAVLSGNAKAVKKHGTGRVVKSGPNDHVFVYFSDHGAPGYLCFPEDELHAKPLLKTLIKMSKKKHFAKMMLYVEACESGSMFKNLLPKNINIFAMTAANASESSYACYYDELRQTYLGDVFSVMWMEDSEQEDLVNETIEKQYEVVKKETNESHVTEFGDLKITRLPVAYFLGYSNNIERGSVAPYPPITDAVSSRDVPYMILKRKLNSPSLSPTERAQVQKKLDTLIQRRSLIDQTVLGIVKFIAHSYSQDADKLLRPSHELKYSNLDCYEDLVKFFSSKCFKISENHHSINHMHVLINFCSEPWVEKNFVKDVMTRHCSKLANGSVQND